MILDGLLHTEAIPATESEEVLVAKIQSSETNDSIWENKICLISIFSTMASITKLLLEISFISELQLILEIICWDSSLLIFPFSTKRLRIDFSLDWEFSNACGEESTIVTALSFDAAT